MKTVFTEALKPFRVGEDVVTRDALIAAVDRLANLPSRFQALAIGDTLLPGRTVWQQQEATNRLMQRWRKLGLCRFDKARWSLSKGAWDMLQTAAAQGTEARRAETA